MLTVRGVFFHLKTTILREQCANIIQLEVFEVARDAHLVEISVILHLAILGNTGTLTGGGA